jgi:hypothetical protein
MTLHTFVSLRGEDKNSWLLLGRGDLFQNFQIRVQAFLAGLGIDLVSPGFSGANFFSLLRFRSHVVSLLSRIRLLASE